MAIHGARSKTGVAVLEVARPAPTTRGSSAWLRGRAAAPRASRIHYMALGRLASTTAGQARAGTGASPEASFIEAFGDSRTAAPRVSGRSFGPQRFKSKDRFDFRFRLSARAVP